jgi:hypothetical protein
MKAHGSDLLDAGNRPGTAYCRTVLMQVSRSSQRIASTPAARVLLDRRKRGELDGIQGDARFALALLAYGNHVVVAQIEADEGRVIAHQPYLLEPPEHLLDAGEPSHRLLILTIGVGEGNIDASLHRLALPHFIE